MELDGNSLWPSIEEMCYDNPKVKDVRGKIRTGDSMYAQWVGVYRQKQVLLCAYHHDLLYKGNLNYSDMTIICNFAN